MQVLGNLAGRRTINVDRHPDRIWHIAAIMPDQMCPWSGLGPCRNDGLSMAFGHGQNQIGKIRQPFRKRLTAMFRQIQPEFLHHVNGLFWSSPLLAALMLVALLSLAGIPLTAGFVGKFYIINAAIRGHNWILLAVLVIGSAIGIYYYLRVIYHMSRRPEEHHTGPGSAGGLVTGIVSSALIAGILLLGITPQPLMAFLRSIL